MAEALIVLMGDSGSASKEGPVKQVSSSDLSIDDDSIAVVTKRVVETETIVEGSFEKLKSDLGVENDVNLDIDVHASGGNLNQYAQCLPQFIRNTRLPKVDFPHFGGEGPSEWLRKASEYFQIHQVSDELRLGIAKMHLEGKAYVWFYGFIANHPGADWSLFSNELRRRFSETIEEEVIESFSKTRPLGTMEEHQESEESDLEKIQGGEEVMEVSIDALVGSQKHKTITVPGMISERRRRRRTNEPEEEEGAAKATV